MQIPLFKFKQIKVSLAPIKGNNGLRMHFFQVLAEREHISRLREPENGVISLPRLGFLRWLNLTARKRGRKGLGHCCFAEQAPTVLFLFFFLELMLIPGSTAQLLNQPMSKPCERRRLPLAGSSYFVTCLLHLMYYNLYQIALCLLKWTIRIRL